MSRSNPWTSASWSAVTPCRTLSSSTRAWRCSLLRLGSRGGTPIREELTESFAADGSLADIRISMTVLIERNTPSRRRSRASRGERQLQSPPYQQRADRPGEAVPSRGWRATPIQGESGEKDVRAASRAALALAAAVSASRSTTASKTTFGPQCLRWLPWWRDRASTAATGQLQTLAPQQANAGDPSLSLGLAAALVVPIGN